MGLNYWEAMAYIKQLAGRRGIHLGLSRMERLLVRLGNPQQKLSYVHIGGTNGKGSVCAMVSSILQSAGLRVGLFTSPHLERYTERFQINRKEIAPEEIARLITEIQPHLEQMTAEGYEYPTEFEVSTAIAFKFFAEARVDLAVLEVGLGGELDATNVIQPLVTVITNVSLDHQSVLGASLAQITQAKAGIIKPGVPVVTAATGEAWSIINDTAQRLGAPVIRVFSSPPLEKGTGEPAVWLQSSVEGREGNWGQTIGVQGLERKYQDLWVPLPGEHQGINALTAVAVVELLHQQGFALTEAEIYKGLATVNWPGRLELMASDPLTILDGAHNPAGAQRLARFLRRVFSDYRLVFVLGILEDKDRYGIVSELAPLAEVVIVTAPPGPRAGNWAVIAGQAKAYARQVLIRESLPEALMTGWRIVEQWRQKGENGLLCISGSLYLIGEVRKIIKQVEIKKIKKKYEKII